MPFLPRDESDKDTWTDFCRSPEHNPPGMIVLPPGRHTWKCPACGAEQSFYVQGYFCNFESAGHTRIVPSGIMSPDYNTVTTVKIS